jgi:glycosyltransferase involved in cell wall biosynthesis
MIHFSVIIPTYNRPRQLAACLQSLTQLDYPRDHFEVIVVDDGSIEPMDPVADPVQTILNLTLLRQANGGPARARNAGAAIAQGQYLVFTDDDCQPASLWLRSLETKLQTQPEALVGGHTINALPDNLFSTASQMLVDYLYNARPLPSFFASNNFAMAAEQFRQLGGFDTSFPLAAGEDREFCDRWIHQGYSMSYAAEAVVYHAHPMTLKSFWQQQFNYGQGAFHFHKTREEKGRGNFQIQGNYYLNLLRYPLTHGQDRQSLMLTAVVLVSQIAIATGFFAAMVRHQRSPWGRPIRLGTPS